MRRVGNLLGIRGGGWVGQLPDHHIGGPNERDSLLLYEAVGHAVNVGLYLFEDIGQSGAKFPDLVQEHRHHNIGNRAYKQKDARVDDQDARTAIERPAPQPVDHRLYRCGE